MFELHTPFSSHAAAPRGIVLVNDVPVSWVSWEVEQNATYHADTFRVLLAVQDLPKALPVSALVDGRDLRVEILAGYPADPLNYTAHDLSSLIVGRVDEPMYDPIAGTLELTGRDFTGLLIDRKTSEKYRNMTASQIADTLAVRVGLTPVVTATTTKAGSYYDIDHARMAESLTEWDLLCWLAREEGYMVFVRGTELHFEPKPEAGDRVYTIRYDKPVGAPVSFDGPSLSLSRSLTVAKDVVVTVRSWSAKKKGVVIATYPKGKRKGTTPGSSGARDPDGFVINVPGKTYEQALQIAQATHAQITSHEMKLVATLPADHVLAIETPMQLVGTGTAFDQAYFPTSITRQMAFGEPYLMTVHAQNRSPENTPTL